MLTWPMSLVPSASQILASPSADADSSEGGHSIHARLEIAAECAAQAIRNAVDEVAKPSALASIAKSGWRCLFMSRRYGKCCVPVRKVFKNTFRCFLRLHERFRLNQYNGKENTRFFMKRHHDVVELHSRSGVRDRGVDLAVIPEILSRASPKVVSRVSDVN